MIEITGMDGTEMHVSPHQIEVIEETPDTVLQMVSGRKIIVREDVDEIIDRIVEYRRRINEPFNKK